MWITIRSMMFVIGKGIGAFGLGGVILWQVAVNIGPHNCVAIVHVSMPNVDVMIDNAEYHIESMWETPIVCELRPGAHTLRMARSGKTLYQEKFSLGIGQEIVLMAWDRTSETQAPAAPPNHSLNTTRRPLPLGRRTH